MLLLVIRCNEEYENLYMGLVHVKDVTLAHILLYENPTTSGRRLCVEDIRHYGDYAAKVEFIVPRIPKDTQVGINAEHEMDLRSSWT
ncbi:hypothetical protein MKW92_048491 [Papaver armeniacum]|nr:hypothetical protein MKW92_048491 [Papaver armeniacum]